MKLKKSLGQNFLKNTIIAEKIVSYLDIQNIKHIVEIGCGEGSLTRFIIDLPFTSFSIVELDDHWSTEAKKKFASQKNNCIVYNQDILTFNFSQFEDKSVSVIGNIPYNITYDILQLLITHYSKLQQVVLMMQEEVAQKLHKQGGKDYGPISVLIQLLFNVHKEIQVSPQNFIPAPRVMSRVLRLLPSNTVIENIKLFSQFLGIIFKHPRKTLLNNIKGTWLIEKLTDDLLLKKRAQEMSPQELYTLYKKYCI